MHLPATRRQTQLNGQCKAIDWPLHAASWLPAMAVAWPSHGNGVATPPSTNGHAMATNWPRAGHSMSTTHNMAWPWPLQCYYTHMHGYSMANIS
eukprot:5516729-Lingulodinium_polyedra.AAC.1